MIGESNVLLIGPIGFSPLPSSGNNPVSDVDSPSTPNFVYYKFVNNGQYSVSVAKDYALDKLYYTIVGNGGLGGEKNNFNTPQQGSSGGGGGGGLVFPLNALSLATPPINISAVTNFRVNIQSSNQPNIISYQDSSGINISIEINSGSNGLRGNTGPTTSGAPPTTSGAPGGNGGNGGRQQNGMIQNTFASSGGYGGLGGAVSSTGLSPIGPSGIRGTSIPSGSTSNGVFVTFADNNTATIGKPGAGGDNSMNTGNSHLGRGQGGEPGFVLLYYNVNDVREI